MPTPSFTWYLNDSKVLIMVNNTYLNNSKIITKIPESILGENLLIKNMWDI